MPTVSQNAWPAPPTARPCRRVTAGTALRSLAGRPFSGRALRRRGRTMPRRSRSPGPPAAARLPSRVQRPLPGIWACTTHTPSSPISSPPCPAVQPSTQLDGCMGSHGRLQDGSQLPTGPHKLPMAGAPPSTLRFSIAGSATEETGCRATPLWQGESTTGARGAAQPTMANQGWGDAAWPTGIRDRQTDASMPEPSAQARTHEVDGEVQMLPNAIRAAAAQRSPADSYRVAVLRGSGGSGGAAVVPAVAIGARAGQPRRSRGARRVLRRRMRAHLHPRSRHSCVGLAGRFMWPCWQHAHS
jgi:hypothetical protein